MRPARTRRVLALAGAIGVAAVGGACGGPSDTAATPAAASTSGGASVTIKDFAFSPQPLVVAKGTVLQVSNADDAPHTATADDGAFDTGSLGQGESKEVTLSRPGEIAFHCSIHDYMRGVIRVTA